jgi:bifunctional oligoribonuclease and PAP phosphatase NrnA
MPACLAPTCFSGYHLRPMSDAYQQVIDVLDKCKRVLVMTHVRPDGDALGSSAAMALALKQKGIGSEVLLLSHLPRKYAFIYDENGVEHIDVEKGWPADFSFDQFDGLLVVDTGTWSQLPGLKERIENWKAPKVVVDHHLTQEDWADVKLVVPQAAAAGEIVAELLDRWGVTLDKALATALYAAITTDTGWFQFSNTRPETHRLAARLLEAGVDNDRMYQAVYQNERAARLLLQTRAQESLELLLDGRLAVMTLNQRDFLDTTAGTGDTENMINIPLQIATVEVSLLIVEPKEGGAIRVSLRSKGQVDVRKFAEEFGGGGHARASGCKLDLPLKDAHDRVVGQMVEKMK